MTNENDHIVVSPTVMQVIEQFIASLRADPAIEDCAIDRLNNLLCKRSAPKPEEINAAMFEATQEPEA